MAEGKNGKKGKKGTDGTSTINFDGGNIVIGGIVGDNKSDNSTSTNGEKVEGKGNQIVGEVHIDGNTIGKGNVINNGDSEREAELKKEIKKLKKRIKELQDELAGISAIHFIKRNGEGRSKLVSMLHL